MIYYGPQKEEKFSSSLLGFLAELAESRQIDSPDTKVIRYYGTFLS